MKREKIECAIERWVRLRKVSQLAGDPKLGKSLVAFSWAAAISRGRPWPSVVAALIETASNGVKAT